MPSGLAISVTTDSVVSVDMGASEPAGVLVGSLRAASRPARDARRVTTPRNPVRLTGGQARLLPADWAPGGHRRPE
ncbi:MAG: hypothetical protein K0S88_7064, partial [Actinomycetia bacterium]|nr:hypothetical protein [Actinomycetes bacterium]